MKPTKIANPNQMSRRDFTTGLSAGLASSLLVSSSGLATESRQVVVKRLLYVTNDIERRVDLFDITAGHSFVRSFPMAGKRVGGICADAASSRLFISQQTEDLVTAYDLQTDKVLWNVDPKEAFGLKHPDRISITRDGRALYVPMKSSDTTLVLDASNGERIAQFLRRLDIQKLRVQLKPFQQVEDYEKNKDPYIDWGQTKDFVLESGPGECARVESRPGAGVPSERWRSPRRGAAADARSVDRPQPIPPQGRGAVTESRRRRR
ncbi:MAG: hypothetical protein IH899_17205 [Planctomycetes bacterium]|nr:hypothetical protein [Planctomycetota bacterium]